MLDIMVPNLNYDYFFQKANTPLILNSEMSIYWIQNWEQELIFEITLLKYTRNDERYSNEN